jgi:hypothetical protein
MNNLYSTWIFSIFIQHFNVKYGNNAYLTFGAYLRNLMLICSFGCQMNNLSFDTRKLIWMLMSICTMCVDVKWTTCSLNMNFLSMSIQHVLTFDKMSNKNVEWTSFLYLCQKGCIIGDSTFQTAKIAKSRILKSKFWKWRSNFGFFLLPKVRKKIVKKHQIGQLVFRV